MHTGGPPTVQQWPDQGPIVVSQKGELLSKQMIYSTTTWGQPKPDTHAVLRLCQQRAQQWDTRRYNYNPYISMILHFTCMVQSKPEHPWREPDTVAP